MHIRNAGEPFPRPLPRLQRGRRFRGRTSRPDVKRRTSPTACPPSLWRHAVRLLPPAAASVSHPSTCSQIPGKGIFMRRHGMAQLRPSVNVAIRSNTQTDQKTRFPAASEGLRVNDTWSESAGKGKCSPRWTTSEAAMLLYTHPMWFSSRLSCSHDRTARPLMT